MIAETENQRPLPMARGRRDIADLFCGGGGSGSGILNAFGKLRIPVRGTFVNHWSEAIRIHDFNHPTHRHYLSGVEHIQPRKIYSEEQHLWYLWASPSCTHHSVARGGRPVSEQSRASGWCVVQWIRHKRPTHVTIENVKEYQDWGPLKQKRKGGKKLWTYKPTEDARAVEVTEVPFKQLRGEPKYDWLKRLSDAGYEMCLEADKTKKGRIFNRWIREIRRLGYQVEYRVLCSADYGDPTTRRRLFVNCVRIDSGRRIVWPNPTHAKPNKNGKVPKGLRPWRTAAEIIDWSDEGKSIFTRKRPLAEKTMRRIAIGLIKYGLKDFLVPQHQGWKNDHVVSVEEPFPTVTGSGADRLVRPYITQMMGQSTAQSAEAPVTALVAGLKHGVVQPCLINMHGNINTSVNSVEVPLRTVSAGGQHHGILQTFARAFQMAPDHSSSTGRGTGCRPIDMPTMTSVTKNNQAVVNVSLNKLPPSIIHAANGISWAGEESRVKSPGEPLGTIHAGGGSFAVLQPTIIQIHGHHITASADRTSGSLHCAPEQTHCGSPAGIHPGASSQGDGDRGPQGLVRGHPGRQADTDNHAGDRPADGNTHAEDAGAADSQGHSRPRAGSRERADASACAASASDAAGRSVNESAYHAGPAGPVPEGSTPWQPRDAQGAAADHRAGSANAGHHDVDHGRQHRAEDHLAPGGPEGGHTSGDLPRGSRGGGTVPGRGQEDLCGRGLRIHLDETHGANHQGSHRVWSQPDDCAEPAGADEARPAVRAALERVRALAGNARPGVDAAAPGPANPRPQTQTKSAGRAGEALPAGKLEPFIVGTAHAGDGRIRSILEPLATVCGNRGDYGVVTGTIRPWVYTYYTSGSTGAGIDEPTPTVRTHEGIGLVVPEIRPLPEGVREVQYPVLEINGKFFLLDLKYRMFQVRELARAQGFPDSFQFPGTKTDSVRAIGNSVSCGVAEALTLANETQNPDISHYVDAEHT